MSTAVRDALDGLKQLGTVPFMNGRVELAVAPLQRARVNSHIHLPPNFSAFQTVKQAVDLAAAQRVGVLGVSNYYDYDVYGDFVSLARRAGIFPLFGLEIISLVDELVRAGVKINDPGNPGKMYICGKGITRIAPFNDEATRILNIIRHNDSTRMKKMIERLETIFSERGAKTSLNEAAVIDMVVHRHACPPSRVYLQERHICQAFQEAMFAKVPSAQRIEKLTRVLGTAPKAGADDAVKIQNEIRTHLMKSGKPGYIDETFINFPEAHRLILALGGIPAYPTLADGTKPICAYEEPLEKLIGNIKGLNVHAAEFIPIRNTPEVLSEYVKTMRAAGLVITAGTEHNTLDLLPIEPTCLNSVAVPADLKEIFWEGTCVVAAHQFLTLHGQCGFVDAQGNPNPAYKNAEARIAAFRKLGEAVIQRYQEVNGALL